MRTEKLGNRGMVRWMARWRAWGSTGRAITAVKR